MVSLGTGGAPNGGAQGWGAHGGRVRKPLGGTLLRVAFGVGAVGVPAGLIKRDAAAAFRENTDVVALLQNGRISPE